MKCAVYNCDSDSKSHNVSFFRFPTDPRRQKKWISFCDHGKTIYPKNSHICMLHFHDDDILNFMQYEMGYAQKRILRREAVPSIMKDADGNTIYYREFRMRNLRDYLNGIVEEDDDEFDEDSVSEDYVEVDY